MKTLIQRYKSVLQCTRPWVNSAYIYCNLQKAMRVPWLASDDRLAQSMRGPKAFQFSVVWLGILRIVICARSADGMHTE